MSISDNARERARIARLNALESEERVQNFGEVGDSRVVVINYDPDKKAYLVRTLGGQIGYAMNISGTQLGVGATVQATRKGNGFIIDYFDQSSGKGTGNSNDKGNDLSKDAFNGSNNSGVFSSFGGANDGENVYIAGPNGECTLTNVAVGKAPAGSFKTLAECRAAQDNDYNCDNGVCKPVAKGTGRYSSLVECNASLIPAPFTGGQCANVLYGVQAFIGGAWQQFRQLPGPVTQLELGRLAFDPPNRYVMLNGEELADRFPTGTPLRLQRLDNQPDNCGDRKVCPP